MLCEIKNNILLKDITLDKKTKYKIFELFLIKNFRDHVHSGFIFDILNKYISSDINILIKDIDIFYEAIFSLNIYKNIIHFIKDEFIDNIECHEDNKNTLLIHGGRHRKSQTIKNNINRCDKYKWKATILHSCDKKYTVKSKSFNIKKSPRMRKYTKKIDAIIKPHNKMTKSNHS
jgi:hypothetical protein